MSITELEECIGKYGTDIYTFCLHLAGGREEADDLYQDTFLTAMECLERIDAERNPKSFLLSVAAGQWKNRKRKAAWRQRIAGVESIGEREWGMEAGTACSVEDNFLISEEIQMVRKCIGELADKYRIPLYLYYMEELSIAEISNALHLAQGTVKSRLHRARKLLRKKIDISGREFFYEETVR